MRYVIWTADTCNLSCDYCYEKETILQDNVIDINDENKVLMFLTSEVSEIKSITFHGAEPLMGFNYIKSIVEKLYEKNKSIEYDFTTNGTIMNTQIEEFLYKYRKVFTQVSVSIDGKEESHNRNRKYRNGRGSYESAKINTLILLNIFPNLRCRMTLTSNNVNDLYDNIVSIHQLGVNIIVPSLNYYDEEWDEKCFEILTKQLKLIRGYCEKHPQLEVSLFDELDAKRNMGKCNLSYNIYVDGKIYPCIYVVNDEQFLIGDVRNGLDKSRLTYLCELNCKDNSFCFGCTNIKYCINNRCKYMNYSITGEMYLPSKVGCQFEHYKVLYSKGI